MSHVDIYFVTTTKLKNSLITCSMEALKKNKVQRQHFGLFVIKKVQ